MRASGDHQRFAQVRRTLGVLALSVGLLTSSSCARRYQLTPGELDRIENRERATEQLSVYVSKKLVVIYELEDDKATYGIGGGTIETSSQQNMLRVIIGKNTPGLILDVEDRNGAPLLWVTFTAKCTDKDCAYGFVQTEDGVFRLHSAPEFDDYKPPKVYYKSEKKQMKLGKLKSLAEKNDVFLWKNRRDKIFTIDLIVKKRDSQKSDVTTIKNEGVKQK